MNIMFQLTSGCSIQCPLCKGYLDIEWLTEYGDPLYGEHEATCPSCNKNFNLVVDITYATYEQTKTTYTVSKGVT